MSSDERGSGGVALDGALGQRPRRSPCRYLYPRQQSRVACEQWERMELMVAASSRSKAPPSSSSAAVDHGPGYRGLTPSRIAVLRQSLDPGLVRFVQTETAAALKGSVPRLNSGGLDGYEQLDEEGCSLYRGQTAVSPRLTAVRQCDGVVHTREFSDDHSSCCQLGMTPWKDARRCYSPGLKGLHEEIEDFFGYMRPFPEEQSMRQDIIKHLTQIVLELWPAAEVKVFGSFKTDLYLPTSDIDLVVMCDDVDSQTALKMLEQKLTEKNGYDDIKVIRTSVPIVKFTDRATAVKVDVSFNVQTGILSADFIESKMGEYSELPYLVLVLKQFLLSRNLLESFNGGISSYCLILLIISYLQLHPDDRKTGNHGDMLIKFLELYGRHFNYLRTGIRIVNGGEYFPKNENEGELGNRFSLLCIEDPFNPANDVGQGCYGAMKVREDFDRAYRELSDAVLPQYRHIQPVGSSFLGRILLMPPEVIQYRQLIRDKYREFSCGTQPVVPPLTLESLSPTIDDNRSDDTGSTCSQNSSLSSEHQMTKSNTRSSSNSCSVSPSSSLLSENESDLQSDGTGRNSVYNSQMKINAASFESGTADSVTMTRVESDPYYPQRSPASSSAVSGSNSAFPHHAAPPPHHPPPPPVTADHPAYHTGGQSNSWHSARSQGQKLPSSALQRPAAPSAATAPSATGPTGVVRNPRGSKTFSHTPRGSNNSEQQKRKVNNRPESNSASGGGCLSNR